MPRRRKVEESGTSDLFDVTAKLRTAPCVPALREAVKAWRAGGYKGITETTRALFNYWFNTDHRTPDHKQFAYYEAQREAMETLVFVWEYEKVRNRKDLLERYVPERVNVRLPQYDDYARYCIKMATGSGKTKVMALAVAWQYLNAVRDEGPDYAKTFLIIAPNVIVYERLRLDFESERIFRFDPVIPKEMQVFWDLRCILRNDMPDIHYEGLLVLTNIQQLYEKKDRSKETEPEAMSGVLGDKPSIGKLDMRRVTDCIGLRAGYLMVINDEAHHTHDEKSEWSKVIRGLHERTPITAQLDFTATPRFQKGSLFPWTIYDYPLKQAIQHGIVKRPIKGIANVEEAKSDLASVKYRGFLAAGVERWREYKELLTPLKRKPVLFIMMNSTKEADDVADWLQTKYPEDFGDKKTHVIHTDRFGEITKDAEDEARRIAREVDREDNPVNAIVSVLMLREGWDVKNVTVVVGLRPYTSKAQILPEQTIGRGLRLMFRPADIGHGYKERVDIIGNKAFIGFVEDLEKLEEIELDTFLVGEDRLQIVSIWPMLEEKGEHDIGMPILTPSLVRKKSLAQEIAALDVMAFACPPLPLRESDEEAKTFKYEGFDVLTMEKIVERKYALPEPQTAQEVIGYYAKRIAEQVKLPSHFAAIVPKVREFLEFKAFGKQVDLTETEVIHALVNKVVAYVTIDLFTKALRKVAIDEQHPILETPALMLSATEPFPWSRPTLESGKTIFNLVACDNEFEKEFARFLRDAPDVKSFAKIPLSLGFSIEYTDTILNLRYYYPDFVALGTDGCHWLIETKGLETTDVPRKDEAAANWCRNATELTGQDWRYMKVKQADYEALRPNLLAEASRALQPSLFD